MRVEDCKRYWKRIQRRTLREFAGQDFDDVRDEMVNFVDVETAEEYEEDIGEYESVEDFFFDISDDEGERYREELDRFVNSLEDYFDGGNDDDDDMLT
jgi:hypothetical protein